MLNIKKTHFRLVVTLFVSSLIAAILISSIAPISSMVPPTSTDIESDSIYLVGTWDNSTNECTDVFVQGIFAFITFKNEGFKIINISNPLDLTLIGEFYDGGNASQIFVEGNFVYLSDGSDGFEIINITNPFAPEEIGNFTSVENVQACYIEGDIAVICDNTTVRTLNITDKTNPIEMDFYSENSNEIMNVVVQNNYAYIAAGLNNLMIINITEPNDISKVGLFDDNIDVAANASSLGVYVDGDFVFVADDEDGLEIFNTTDITNPIKIGQNTEITNATDVFVSNGMAFVTGWGYPLNVINISDLTNPNRIDYYTEGFGNAVVVYEEIAFVADYFNGLTILSPVDPTSFIPDNTTFPENFTDLIPELTFPFGINTATLVTLSFSAFIATFIVIRMKKRK